MLNRTSVLEAKDRAIVEVSVPEWGGTVGVRGLSGRERDEYVMECQARRKGQSVDVRGLSAKLVALACCDADGNRLFTDADVDALAQKSGAVLDRLSRAIIEHNGLSPEEQKQLEGN